MSSIPPDTAAEVEKLEELHRQHPEGRYFVPLADRYRKLGMVDQAEELLRGGLRKHPDYLSAHIVLGGCLADRSALEEAADEFRYVLSQDPQNLIALRTLGELAAQDGRAAEAERWYQELLSVDPMNKEARQALDALGGDRPESAAAAVGNIERSAAVEPQNEPDELQDWGTVLLDEPAAAAPDTEAAFDPTSFAEVTFTTAGADDGPAASEVELSDGFDLDLSELDSVAETPPAAAPDAAPADPASDGGGWTLLDFGGEETAADDAPLAGETEEEVVTETIADLYARQGLHERAAGVYRELIRRRGGDAALEAKLATNERAARGEVVSEVGRTGGDDFLTFDDEEFGAGGSDEPEWETESSGDLDLGVPDPGEAEFDPSQAGSESDADYAFAASFEGGFDDFAGNGEQAPEKDSLGATPSDDVGEPDYAAAVASTTPSSPRYEAASDASAPAIREWFAELLDWTPGASRVTAVEVAGEAPAAGESWTTQYAAEDEAAVVEPFALEDEVEMDAHASASPEVAAGQEDGDEEDLSWLTDILDEGTALGFDEEVASPPPAQPPQPASEEVPDASAVTEGGDEDLASFQAWLQSLKR